MSLADKSFSILQRDVLLFVTNIITSIVVARTLGPAGLGIFMILSLVPSYAESLGRLKVDQASVYFQGRNEFRQEDLLLNLNIIALCSSGLVISLILWQYDFLYALLFSQAEDEYQLHLLTILIAIPIQFLSLNYSYFHIGLENVAVYNRIVVIRAWSCSSLSIGLLLLSNLGLWSLIIAVVASNALGLVYGWWKIDRTSWGRALWRSSISSELIRYGGNFYLDGILAQLQISGTRTITVVFLAPGQVAFLGQAQSICNILNKVPEAINTILYPRLSRVEEEEAVELSCRAFRASFILMATGGIILGLLSEPLITLMYGSAFITTASVIQLILAGIVISGVCGTLSTYFGGTGRARFLPRITILPLAFQLTVAYMFTQQWGLNGAAAALSLGLAVYGAALCIVFLKVSRTSFRQLIPGRSDIRYLIKFAIRTAKQWKQALSAV